MLGFAGNLCNLMKLISNHVCNKTFFGNFFVVPVVILRLKSCCVCIGHFADVNSKTINNLLDNAAVK